MGLPAVKSSRLLDVSCPALTCSRYLHFCDANQILVRVNISFRGHVVALVPLKGLRIVRKPHPLAWTVADNIAFRARDGVLQGNCI